MIPCYNEEENLPFLFKKLEKILGIDEFEIVLVDNGSKDNTFSVIKSFRDKYKNINCLKLKKNIGYGNGILKGLEVSSGKILAWTHADMQTNPEDILIGLKFFNNGSEKVFVKGIRNGRPFADRFFSIGMSIFSSFILRSFFWDINAQPTMFRSSFLKELEDAPNDFSLDLFVYYLARKKNYKISRFPVFFNKRLFGMSSWNKDFKSKLRFISRTFFFTLDLAKRFDLWNI